MNLAIHPKTQELNNLVRKMCSQQEESPVDLCAMYATNVVVHALALRPEPIQIVDVIEHLKSQASKLIVEKGENAEVNSALLSLRKHPKEHYDVVVASIVGYLTIASGKSRDYF